MLTKRQAAKLFADFPYLWGVKQSWAADSTVTVRCLDRAMLLEQVSSFDCKVFVYQESPPDANVRTDWGNNRLIELSVQKGEAVLIDTLLPAELQHGTRGQNDRLKELCTHFGTLVVYSVRNNWVAVCKKPKEVRLSDLLVETATEVRRIRARAT